MIDVNDYRGRLEARLLAAGFVKLDKPVKTKEVFYVGMIIDETLNFDMSYWNPTVISLLRTMTEAGINGFYQLNVYYGDVYYGDDNALWVTVSRGVSNGRLP